MFDEPKPISDTPPSDLFDKGRALGARHKSEGKEKMTKQDVGLLFMDEVVGLAQAHYMLALVCDGNTAGDLAERRKKYGVTCMAQVLRGYEAGYTA